MMIKDDNDLSPFHILSLSFSPIRLPLILIVG